MRRMVDSSSIRCTRCSSVGACATAGTAPAKASAAIVDRANIHPLPDSSPGETTTACPSTPSGTRLRACRHPEAPVLRPANRLGSRGWWLAMHFMQLLQALDELLY